MHMDPAKTILDRIGFEKAADVTGKSISRVYRWAKPQSHGGTGGVIPHADAIKLLDYCRAENIAVTEADFMKAPLLVTEAEQQQGAA